MSWKPNPGYCPPTAKGKRVKVKLRNGNVESGWPADRSVAGRNPPMRWTLEDHPADVLEWDFA